MQGQHYDEESGLHYNRHRYYDPAPGRYITQDPIGLMGGNVYSHVNNNPVSLIDPMGLDAMVLVGGATQGNPIGHSALAFSGHGVYSYSTRTMYGSSTSDYLNSQAMKRDTKAYILKTNSQQEKKMRDFIEKIINKMLETIIKPIIIVQR
ncbi:RHS repeat-associated core domain-containing protein [Rahnella laticis]|uniref:RHS repeat-associated core domain-containing protein n=1 Tax=Rahnella laticis TaxID=2787622 RepID=UPI002DD864C8|nr:RHS repeat-associated core domain-containing protein [Rahnella laticis]